MGSYTSVSHGLAQEIVDLYGLGQVKSLRPLSLGISNSNYKISTEDKNYLLKISNAKDHSEVNNEMKILNALKEKYFPYSLVPFQTLEGQSTYELGEYFGVLFPFVDGIPPGPSDQTCHEIGQGLAQLHEIPWSEAEAQKLRPFNQVGDDYKNILEFTKTKECPADFKNLFQELLLPQAEKWENHQHQMGLIHGDLYYDNTLFDNNTLNVMLDFEQAGMGRCLLDLGISISGTCLEKGRIIRPLIDSYLDGYESVTPLSKEEKDLLDYSITLGLFSISLWRIHRFMIGNLSPNMQDSYKSLLYKANNFAETRGEL